MATLASRAFAGICALLVQTAVTAAEPGKARADLLGVYQAALANDAQLAAARHAYQAQREAVPQARAGLLPSLTAGATSEATRLSRDEPQLSRERSGTTFRANLNQPLFRLDRWYGLKAAHSTVAQAELELAAQEQGLIFRAAEAYFDTLRQLDTWAAARAEEQALLRQRDQAQGRLDDGAASLTDVLDAQAAYDVALANRQLAQRQVDDAYEALLRLTSKAYAGIAGISHRLPIEPPLPNAAQAWVEVALRQNLPLQASQFAVDAAADSLRQRKAGHAPTLDAVASVRQGDNDSFGYSNPTDFGSNGYRGNVTQSTIGLELNIPLYSGGQVNSQVRESSARLSQRQDELDDRRRETVLTTRNAHRAVNTDIEQVRARRQSIVSGEKAVEANQVGLTVGTRNVSDVLNAERQLYAAVRDYNDARYAFILDTLRLKQAAGTLAPSDLQALAVFLDPDYVPERDFLPKALR